MVSVRLTLLLYTIKAPAVSNTAVQAFAEVVWFAVFALRSVSLERNTSPLPAPTCPGCESQIHFPDLTAKVEVTLFHTVAVVPTAARFPSDRVTAPPHTSCNGFSVA